MMSKQQFIRTTRTLCTFLFLLAGLMVFSSCSHSVHLVHVSDFETPAKINQGQVIESESQQFVILGFASDTLYVENAYDTLVAKCPGSEIQGITTRYSTSHNFLSWTNKIHLWGFCLNHVPAKV